MNLRHAAGLALLAGALTFAASVPASAYLKYQMKNATISSYSISGAGADDLPMPPPLAAPAPSAQAATPKLLEPAIKGKIFKAAPGEQPATQLRAAPRR